MGNHVVYLFQLDERKTNPDNKMEKSIANYLIVYVLVFLVLLLSVSVEAGDLQRSFSSVALAALIRARGLGQVEAYKQLLNVFWFNTFVLAIGMIGTFRIYQSLCFSAPQQQ